MPTNPLVEAPVLHSGFGMRILVVGIIVLTALGVAPAWAHQTFLLPARHHWSSGDHVTIGLTSALAFPDSESGPATDRILSTAIIVGGKTLDTFTLTPGKTTLDLQFKAERSGLAVVAISSKSRYGEIARENAEDYFDEIGASEATRRRFAALSGSPALRRSYSKHTKAIVCIDDCLKGHAARGDAIGQALEFVAVADNDRGFRLLRDGKPLADHAVTLDLLNKVQQQITSDATGAVAIDMKVHGVVMLGAVVITLPDQADGIYHSDYATLVVELQ